MKRSRVGVCALALAGSVALSASAMAFDEKQEAFVSRIAEAQAIASKCPALEINLALGAFGLQELGVTISEPEAQELLQARYSEASEQLAGRDRRDVCQTGMMLFGPEGKSTKNLLRTAD